MNVLAVKTALLASVFLVIASTQAEEPDKTPPKAPKSICESMAGFNDWNFWVGDWKVYSNDDKRTFQGTNKISKHHKNCLIMENLSGGACLIESIRVC